MLRRLSVCDTFFINCSPAIRVHNTKKLPHVFLHQYCSTDNRGCRDIQTLSEMKRFGKYRSKQWSLSL
jgi:hypothetical protein